MPKWKVSDAVFHGRVGKQHMATALVTGTSSGIGLATAVALARAGHAVAATMRNLDRAGDLREVAAKEQLAIDIEALDVDDDDSVREGFAKVVGRHGPIDVLVKNAGIPGVGVFEDTSLDIFCDVMETNFFGTLRRLKAVIPSMRERRRGTSSTFRRLQAVSRLPLRPVTPRRNGR